jgi:small subunit ribosomal protein S6
VRPYEVMIIIDAGLDDEVIRSTIDRASALVTKGGGTVGKVDRWGKRRFAYEVNHRSEGYYALLETTAEPTTMEELHRMLGLADEVIRHKVIRLPDKVAGRAARTTASEAAAAPTQGA